MGGDGVTGSANEIDRLLNDPRRVIEFERARNFRDIGGYRTISGRTVRWGRVYRSAKLCNLTDADTARLHTLGIVAAVDLRTREERESEPSRWREPPRHLHVSSHESVAATRQRMRATGSVAAAEAVMLDNYADRANSLRNEFRGMFELLAAGRVPMLVHCTAGKDRTGAACALILGALGVDRETILADYALTARLLPLPGTRSKGALPVGGREEEGQSSTELPAEVLAAVWDAKPAYLERTLDAVAQEYGSIERYLRSGLGLTADHVASLEEHLTE
jgi:protein-tyrosine phosphatase